jgi:tRNA threonylcarbamoyladenosine biosynthesis protein TsaB
LRVGLAAARGYGLALGRPVIGVPSLLALSLSLEPGAAGRCTVPAGRSGFWRQDFAGPGEALGAPEFDPEPPPSPSTVAGIEKLALFAQTADPKAFPPSALYLRPPDARPQAAKRLLHQP